MTHKILKQERGFTIIEVIAVLVILGILVAIAIPKYIDIQEQARRIAMGSALADGISTMNMSYAKLMLSNGGTVTTTQVATKASSNSPASDDFLYLFSSKGLVTVRAKSSGAVDGASDRTKQWYKP